MEARLSVLDAITRKLGNIGVVVVSASDEGGTTVLLVQGKANGRKAQCSFPNGVLSSQDEANAVKSVVADAKRKISSNVGVWTDEP